MKLVNYCKDLRGLGDRLPTRFGSCLSCIFPFITVKFFARMVLRRYNCHATQRRLDSVTLTSQAIHRSCLHLVRICNQATGKGAYYMSV